MRAWVVLQPSAKNLPRERVADAALHAGEQVRRVLDVASTSDRLRSARMARACALVGVVGACSGGLVASSRAGSVGHSIFSPSARSTVSLSCARARWMRLFTVPSGQPGDRSDLFVAQVLDVPKHQALAKARLELEDGALDDLLDLLARPSSRRAARRATRSRVLLSPMATRSSRAPSSSCSPLWRTRRYLVRFFERFTAIR